MRVESLHREQPGAGAGGQLTARLLLVAQPVDLLQVAQRGAPGPLGAPGDEHQRPFAEVVEEAGAPVEVRGEEVDAVVVDAELELGEVLPPLLAHLRPAAVDLQAGDGGQGSAHRLGAQVQLPGRAAAAPAPAGATEVWVSTSKARISSTSSPNHSARQGRPRSRPKTSTIPPRTAISPGAVTAVTRR